LIYQVEAKIIAVSSEKEIFSANPDPKKPPIHYKNTSADVPIWRKLGQDFVTKFECFTIVTDATMRAFIEVQQ
jgi:hypothetical protein